jgi:hypothetical protein
MQGIEYDIHFLSSIQSRKDYSDSYVGVQEQAMLADEQGPFE